MISRGGVSAKIFEIETRRVIDVARMRLSAKSPDETETRHENFETKRLQNITNIFNTKLWTFR